MSSYRRHGPPRPAQVLHGGLQTYLRLYENGTPFEMWARWPGEQWHCYYRYVPETDWWKNVRHRDHAYAPRAAWAYPTGRGYDKPNGEVTDARVEG